MLLSVRITRFRIIKNWLTVTCISEASLKNFFSHNYFCFPFWAFSTWTRIDCGLIISGFLLNNYSYFGLFPQEDRKFFGWKKWGPQKCPVHLKMPWLGNFSLRFEDQIKKTITKCFAAANPRLISSTREVLPSIQKDCVPTTQKSLHRLKILIFSAGLSNWFLLPSIMGRPKVKSFLQRHAYSFKYSSAEDMATRYVFWKLKRI